MTLIDAFYHRRTRAPGGVSDLRIDDEEVALEYESRTLPNYPFLTGHAHRPEPR